MNPSRAPHIKKILDTYPQHLQDFIISFSWEQEIHTKGSEIGLTEEQLSVTKDSFLGLLLGIRTEEEVIVDLNESIADKDKIREIEKIFNKLSSDIESLIPKESGNSNQTLADELLHVAGAHKKETFAQEIKQEHPLDTEIMSHFSSQKQTGPATPPPAPPRQTSNPFSDQTTPPKTQQEEKVIPENELPPIIKPVSIPKEAVTPPFEKQAAAEKTEGLHVEQEYSPQIDHANKISDKTYKGNDPYREPPVA